MGRSKFPGKPSKHTHRKRINVLPPSGDMLNIEFGNPVTVKSVEEENKQDEDVNDSDSESAPSENIPKVSLTRRLTRDIKTIRNKNATKRNLLSKMSSKRSNLTCKTLHNFSKTCRESTNLVGKFVLPTRSVHSSRVIKPNKRFISDINEGVTLKRRMSVVKRQDEEKTKTIGSFISEQKCDIEKTAFTNGHKVVLRQARLKLPNHTGTQGPFSTKSNSFPPGTVTCGVCGAVRYYRFVKQARKFNIYSCESCRKFISKMIKRSSCGNMNAQSPLVCHKGQGMCHVSSVVRSQQRKLSKCAYKARCPACWLKMCLRTFHMPSSLKQGLTMMLPKDMQSIFNNSLSTLTWQPNVLLEQPKEEDTMKKRPLRIKNPKPTNPVTVQLPTSDINRQKIDLRGPRVKHVCRSASIVLGQPVATFSEGDKKCEQQEKSENSICDKNVLDTGKGSTTQSETESTCSEKLSKASGSSDQENSNRREKSYRNLTNLYNCSEARMAERKRNSVEPELEIENGISIDYHEMYNPDYISQNGYCLIGSKQFPMQSVCFLCGSAGQETVVHCSVCCEPFHSFCVNLPVSAMCKERRHLWTCEKCLTCNECGSVEKEKLRCIKCRRAFHEECLNTKPCESIFKMCSKCTKCKNCGADSTEINIGNIPFCEACFELRRKDNFCSICKHRYEENELDLQVLECSKCLRWQHSKCENLTSEQYQIACVLPGDIKYVCSVCSKESWTIWKKRITEELLWCFSEVTRLLLKKETARDLLKSSYSNVQSNRLKRIQSNDNTDLDNNNSSKDTTDNVVTITDIKNKLNFKEYRTSKDFNNDINWFLRTLGSEELLNIYNNIFQKVFPWYEKVQAESDLIDSLPISSEEEQDDESDISEITSSVIGDTRTCGFCKGTGDGRTSQESRLIYCGQNEWVHANCAFWSNEVFENIDNSLQNVHAALNRSRVTRCSHCKLKGASVDCCYKGCHETYHFTCARTAKVDFMRDKTVYCSNHEIKKCTITDFMICRSVYVEIGTDRKKLAEIDRVHFMVGSLYVKHLGRIEPSISDCVDAIIPIGFVCTRLFWSTIEPWKLVPYTISTSVQHSNNSSITVNRNFTIDHTLEKTALEKVMREFHLWQKDIDKKSSDIESEDDEEQQNGADILSPELTDAILEELPHDLLDGISVQDIFPKLSCDEIVNIDFKNEIQSSDGFFDIEEVKKKDLKQSKLRPTQRSCSLTLSCKLDSSLTPAIKKRKMIATRENNMLYQILQVDGNCDDSSSSECESPTRTFWVDYVPEEPVTCEKCQCTYRTQASYKRHLDSCEVICTSESDSEAVPEQDIVPVYTNANIEDDHVTLEISEQPVVLSSYETYQSEIHTSVNTQSFVMSKSTAEVIVPQTSDVIITPVEQKPVVQALPVASVTLEPATQHDQTQYCVNQNIPLCINQPITLQNGMQVNPASNQILSINPNTPIAINSLNQQPNSIAFNSINQQPLDFQQSQTVTIQSAPYNNAILNVGTLNGKLMNPVLPAMNVHNASWVKPVTKSALVTQKAIKARPRARTITTKRIDEGDTIILPAQNSNGQVLVSANYVPTFVDSFQQPSQNIQYIATLAPQVNTIPSQSIVQIQPDNNLISIVPGIQQTMYIQQPKVMENQLVIDSNGTLSWSQQPPVQPVYYGFETIVQNTVMQSQQFLPTTVPGILTANSSYSTTTQVFQTSKLEPVLDVSSNSFVLVNPMVNNQPIVSSQPIVNSQQVVNSQPMMNSQPMVVNSQQVVGSQPMINTQQLVSSQPMVSSQQMVAAQPVINHQHQQIITPQQIMGPQSIVEAQVQPVVNTQPPPTPQVPQPQIHVPPQQIITPPSISPQQVNHVPVTPQQMNHMPQISQQTSHVPVCPQQTKHVPVSPLQHCQQQLSMPVIPPHPAPIQAPKPKVRQIISNASQPEQLKASQIQFKPQNRKYITPHKSTTPAATPNSITLPTAPFVPEQGIPTNIVTPIPKATSQSRPMSRVLPMPTNNSFKEKKPEEEFFLEEVKKKNEVMNKPIEVMKVIDVLKKPIEIMKKQVDVLKKPVEVKKPIDVIRKSIDGMKKPDEIVRKSVELTKPVEMPRKPSEATKLVEVVKASTEVTKLVEVVKKSVDVTKPVEVMKKPLEIVKNPAGLRTPLEVVQIGTVEPPPAKQLKIEAKPEDSEPSKLLVIDTMPPRTDNKKDECSKSTSTQKLKSEPPQSLDMPPITVVPPVPRETPPSSPPESKTDTSLKLVFQKQSTDGTYKISNNFSNKQNINKLLTKQPVQVAQLKPIKPDLAASKEKDLHDKITFGCNSSSVRKEDSDKRSILYTVETKDGFKYSSTSISDLWSKILEEVQAAREAHKMPPLPLNKSAFDSVQVLGLKSKGLKYLIEQLPGATKCTKYKPLFNFPPHPSKIDEECMQDHTFGTIRCAPYERKNTEPYDMFGWLSSRHRQPEEISLDTLELLPRRIVNLPMAMKFRQLKLTSKYSVGVYRSCIHGRGLFCLRDIEAGEMVIEYAGEVIRSILTDKREKYYNSKGIGCYMFRVDDNFVVDATMKGNAARFINHSCDPNCYSKVVEILGHKHIIIFALRRILSGEELTYDYKFPFEEDKIPCTCGSRKCRKFLN